MSLGEVSDVTLVLRYDLVAVVIHCGSGPNRSAVLNIPPFALLPFCLLLPPFLLTSSNFLSLVFCYLPPSLPIITRGHYISIVKSHGFWLIFDDDIVDKIDPATIEV